MGDHSELDYHDLADFGTKTQDTVKDYQDSLGAPEGKMAAAAMIGAVGTHDALRFQARLSGVTQATGFFLKDSPVGLMALCFGSIVEAANYAGGDVSQSKSMDDVIEVFNPAPGKDSLDRDISKNTGQLNDKTTIKPLPPPAKKAAPPVCRPPSPREQADQHRDTYGKDEDWRPGPKPPKGKILAPGPIGQQPVIGEPPTTPPTVA